jgi:hypothetical protein
MLSSEQTLNTPSHEDNAYTSPAGKKIKALPGRHIRTTNPSYAHDKYDTESKRLTPSA